MTRKGIWDVTGDIVLVIPLISTLKGENSVLWHVAFPYIDILRYGGKLPSQPDGSIVFCCPDVNVINVFKIEIEEVPD